MASEFTRTVHKVKDIDKQFHQFSNSGDLFVTDDGVYTLLHTEFRKISFYPEFLEFKKWTEEQVKRLDKKIDDLADHVDKEVKRIDQKINNEVSSLNTKINNTNNNVSSLNNRITLIEARLNKLEEK